MGRVSAANEAHCSIYNIGLKAHDVIKGKSQNTLWDLGTRFAQYKLAPSVTVLASLASGKNVIGQEQTATETLIRSYSPLVLQEIVDQYQSTEALSDAALAGLAAGTGVGVSVHNKSKKKTSKFR